MIFANTWEKLFKYCTSVHFLLMEGDLQGALRKELRIAPLVERYKIAALGRTCCSILPVLGRNYLNIAFLSSFAAGKRKIRKKLHIAPFVECFKTLTLGRSYW